MKISIGKEARMSSYTVNNLEYSKRMYKETGEGRPEKNWFILFVCFSLQNVKLHGSALYSACRYLLQFYIQLEHHHCQV